MKTIIANGIIHYKDAAGRFHRINGAAVIFPKDHLKYPNYRAYFIHGEFIGSNATEINESHNKPFINGAKEFCKRQKLKAFL